MDGEWAWMSPVWLRGVARWRRVLTLAGHHLRFVHRDHHVVRLLARELTSAEIASRTIEHGPWVMAFSHEVERCHSEACAAYIRWCRAQRTLRKALPALRARRQARDLAAAVEITKATC